MNILSRLIKYVFEAITLTGCAKEENVRIFSPSINKAQWFTISIQTVYFPLYLLYSSIKHKGRL